jgi:DNA-binding protein HU-beta
LELIRRAVDTILGEKTVFRLDDVIQIKEFNQPFKEIIMAGKPLTKAQLIATLADKTELSKKQITDVLNAQMELAYGEAKNGYTIPGIGKLVVVNRKARMGRNPATGETISIPAKRVLKFRVAKAAKDAIG